MFFRLIPALVLAFATLPAAADPVYPPGSRIGLEPPAGMKRSEQFIGFADTERKAGITVLDLPGRAIAGMEQSLAKETSAPGVTVQKQEDFKFKGGAGKLLTLKVENGTKQRWILYASPKVEPVQDMTMLVTADVPEAARSTYPEAAIRKALASISFRPMPIDEQLSMLPFKLGDLGGFRVLRALPAGIVILTDSSVSDANQQAHVIVLVATGAPEDTSERVRFARQAIETVPFKDVKVTLSEPMRIGGVPGVETRAEAKDPAGADVSVVQWLRFGNSGGFIRLVAITPKAEWDAKFPRFRAVRDGIEPR